MTKNFILLCDHAFVDEKKKLSLIGIFEEMRFESFPASILKIVFAANYSLDASLEDLSFTLDLLDPSGKKIGINIPPIKQAKLSSEMKKINILIELGNLKFDEPGKYTFNLKGNNKKIGEYEFEVKKI